MVVHPQRSAELADDLVFSDDLTGLRNRRFLYRIFSETWEDLVETGGELSLAVVDLDYFKQVNDTHGHLTGDLVLTETAGLIQQVISDRDHAIRYGGDEFVLLLPNRSKAEAGELLEGLRLKLAEKGFVSRDENLPLEVVLSFSIGVATRPEDGATGEELMSAADKALYASKRAGRNRVSLAGELAAELEDEIDPYRSFPAKSVVGRQDMIDRLAGVCELTRLGTGTWTAFHGPAGIGKSRILREALRLGPEAGISCVLVELSEDLAAQPYAAVGALLNEVRRRHPESYVRMGNERDTHLARFLRVHAAEPAAFEPQQGDPGTSPTSAEDLRRSLTEAFGNLTRDRGWILSIDDVAHLDPHSAELLQLLIEQEKLPLAVLSAHRCDPINGASFQRLGRSFLQSIERRPWFEQCPVNPLSRASVDLMISALLPHHHASREFVDLVFDSTGGNPLYVEEVLRIGIATGKIIRRGGEWFVQALDPGDLPASLEEAIARRMSLLDEEIRQDIARASAIGTTLTPELLQALLGKNEGEILDFLDKVRALGFVAGGQRGDLSQVRFSSAAIRDQVYQRMDSLERTRAHREIGKIEEHRVGSLVGALSSRLAYHFERGEVHEKARVYLEAARAAAPPVIVAGNWSESEVPPHRRRRITEAAVPLSDEAWPALDDALRALVQATKSLWMYPAGSPIATSAFEELQRRLEIVLSHVEVLSLAAVEGILVANGVPYPARRQGVVARGLLQLLKSREVRGFTLRQGLTDHEVAFLVEQLAADEPVERDPEIWEALLERRGIDNVDFGDRVYVPADGVAHAPVAEGIRPGEHSGVLRVASVEELDQLVKERSDSRVASIPESKPELSPAMLEALLAELDSGTPTGVEIRELVPVVAELLKRLLAGADSEIVGKYQSLGRAMGLPGRSPSTPLRRGASESRIDNLSESGYVERIRSERKLQGRRQLLEPAVEKFREFVEARDLTSARSVLRFIRQCQAIDDGDGELAQEGEEALARVIAGDTLDLLLADLMRDGNRPDPEALDLLLEIGHDGGRALVTFLRQADDPRARRVVARLLKELGGEALESARQSITHGDNPVVARRVISVLESLSPDLAGDLSTAVQVRNPGVLGEAIRLLQRQPRILQLQVIGALLQSASPELVCRGIYYLSEWGLSEAKDSLLSLLEHSEDYEILAATSAALARWQLSEAVPVLGEMLGRKQVMRLVPFFPRGLRREFARALAAIGTEEARAKLAEFTKDVDSEIRNIARGMPAPTGA